MKITHMKKGILVIKHYTIKIYGKSQHYINICGLRHAPAVLTKNPLTEGGWNPELVFMQ